MSLFDEARVLDAADSLAQLRERFVIPDGVSYLDGNSLGVMPKAAKAVMDDAVNRQWGHDLIRSWNDNDWIDAPQRIGGKIAPLIGAQADEVIVADSVSVNIFKLLTALLRKHPGRGKFVTEAGNFPTDAHVAAGAAEFAGVDLRLLPRDEIMGALDDDTAALLLTHVHYKTGEKFDMVAVNAAAKQYDIPVLWDLSHSTGAVPLDLKQDGGEYAVGCGYKYLNGGPGAPAFVYVAKEQQDDFRTPLQGWMGHKAPFDFEDKYTPGKGMDRFLVGTPPVLSLLALETGIDAFEDVAMDALWEKSQKLFDFLTAQMDEHCPELELITPQYPDLRGSHASYAHPDAWPINNALIAQGVIGDFRTPDVLRLGLTPLYTSFEDIARAVTILSDIMNSEEWRKPEYAAKSKVT